VGKSGRFNRRGTLAVARPDTELLSNTGDFLSGMAGVSKWKGIEERPRKKEHEKNACLDRKIHRRRALKTTPLNSHVTQLKKKPNTHTRKDSYW